MIFHGIHGPHLLFHSSDDGHSDCFHVLAVVDGGILLSREKEENCAICKLGLLYATLRTRIKKIIL